MLQKADELGCEYIATGHYARIMHENGRYFLRKGVDLSKDQTYFLWRLSQENLARTVFPLGEYTKDQIRAIADEKGFKALVKKRESQEICFVPDNDYRAFLRANVPDYSERVRAGEFIDAQGKVLGKHQGYTHYTIGQRKGLGIALGQPAYVTHIDAATNRVTLGSYDDLYATELRFRPMSNAFRPSLQEGGWDGLPLPAKVRYRSKAVELKAPPFKEGNGVGLLRFCEPVWGVTPGQSVVLYQDDLVIGGGIIC